MIFYGYLDLRELEVIAWGRNESSVALVLESSS